MNEQIKELMEQAGLYDFVIESMGINEEIEKFAELIVQECVGIGERYADGNYEVRNQILSHFGLEEE